MATHGTHQPSRDNAASPAQASIRRFLCLLLLLAPLGCAHARPSPLPAATKEQLGTIGVVAAQFTPEVDYRTPGRGGAGGAAIGTAKGLGLGIAGAALCFVSYGYAWPACGLAIATPYLATRLAMDQARAGVAPSTIEAAESAIKAVLAERSHGPVVRDEAFRLAAAHTGHTFVLLPDPGPTKATETPCYRHLAAEGIDTVRFKDNFWHYVPNWEHFLAKSTANSKKNPFSDPRNRKVTYSRKAIPHADDILGRTLIMGICVKMPAAQLKAIKKGIEKAAKAL